MTTKSLSEFKNVSVLKAHVNKEWTKLFNRKNGWTGADGIYSIPLSGKEIWSEFNQDKTVFLFSDTFISDVDNNNRRHNNIMINNSYAVMNGNIPYPGNINFYWGEDAADPLSVFVPPSKTLHGGDRFWLMDGIYIGETLYILGLRIMDNPGHIFNFKIIGVTLLCASLDMAGRIADYTQLETSLFYKGKSAAEEVVFGQAIMPLTQRSQDPDADGYIYIYGPRGALTEKELLAARVTEDHFSFLSEWRFWNGESWSDNIEECAALTSGISQEFSVSPLGKGMFIVVFLNNNQVAVRFGTSPVGPFGPVKYVWQCRETDNDPDVYVYNAKAHPHLSKPGELLISYNVNCYTLERHDIEADLYRPRFISLTLDGEAYNDD